MYLAGLIGGLVLSFLAVVGGLGDAIAPSPASRWERLGALLLAGLGGFNLYALSVALVRGC